MEAYTKLNPVDEEKLQPLKEGVFSLPNQKVIDKFSENESGELLYDGKLITERPYLTISGVTTDYMYPSSNYSSSVSLIWYNSTYTDDKSNIYELEGKEIKNLWFKIDGTRINVRDLSALDGTPYAIIMNNLVMSPSFGSLHLVTLASVNAESEFIYDLSAYVGYEFELEIYL